MDYEEAAEYLDGLINYEVLPRAGRIAGLSIDTTRRLLWCMGDPHKAYPSIHVTGTNGKGSTVRMTARLLRAMGLRVGVYTSPHLVELTERIEVDDARISPEAFGALTGSLSQFADFLDIRPTWFEAVTAVALAHFADIAVDAAVVEVGMLGRFDATNAVDGTVAVLTNVGFDHTDGRGDWRRAVAREKAGIVKPSSAAVCGETHPAVREVFCGEPNRYAVARGEDFGVRRDRLAVGGRLLDLHTPHAAYEELFVAMHGRHQAENASLAITAVEAFFEAALPEEVVSEAMADTMVPGRFEIVGRRPLVVLDVAHNPDGARAVMTTLRSDFTPSGRLVLVVGLQNGRSVSRFVEALDLGADACLVACTAPSLRGVPADDIAAAAARAGVVAEVCEPPTEAYQRALSLARPEDAVIVCGSFTIVGAVRESLRDRAAVGGASDAEPADSPDEFPGSPAAL